MDRLAVRIETLGDKVSDVANRLGRVEQWKESRETEPPALEITNRLTALETRAGGEETTRQEGITRRQWTVGIIVVIVLTVLQIAGSLLTAYLTRPVEADPPSGS